jgi:cytochrome c556
MKGVRVVINKSAIVAILQNMKYKCVLITLVGAAALAVGCDRVDKSSTDSREATARQLDKVKADTQEAARDMNDYAFTQKAEFVAKMQAQLAELNRDLDQLSARIEKSSDAAKAEAKPKLQALREQAHKLNQQLDAAKDATESTWDDIKNGSKKAYASLKDDFNQARQWVSNKIAP